MPLGIQDSWVDGLESYVLVSSTEAAVVAGCFGQVVPWWPADPAVQAEHPWMLSPPHEEAWLSARRRIRAFTAREGDLASVLVQSGDSNAAAWSADDDYHTPMYEDALAAMRATVPSGPELYESPVRIARRLSRELSTCAAALWGRDEEPGLEGICLWNDGVLSWAASTYTAGEIEQAFLAFTEGRRPEGLDTDRYDSFFLAEGGSEVVRIDEPISEWADARLRAVGLGLDISLSPHSMHPFDLMQHEGMGLSEFVVAVGS